MMYVVIENETGEALYITASLKNLKSFLIHDVVSELEKSFAEEKLDSNGFDNYSEIIRRILEENPSNEGFYAKSINYYAYDILILPDVEVES